MQADGTRGHRTFEPNEEEVAAIVRYYEALQAMMRAIQTRQGTPIGASREWAVEIGIVRPGIVHFTVMGKNGARVEFIQQWDMGIESTGEEDAPLHEGFLPV